jgi:type IV secretory pathway VirB10-like protein
MLLAVSLGAALSVAAPVDRQSLADLSRAAEKSRNTTSAKPAVKVYTNKDLPAVEPPPPPPPGNATAPAAAPAAPVTAPPVPADTPPVKDETYWRERMRPLRERLDSLRALADQTKRRAEELMRASDRCFAVGVVCEDYNESLRLTDQHKMILADVARAEREVFALEEEARRAGVPPGWLRP